MKSLQGWRKDLMWLLIVMCSQGIRRQYAFHMALVSLLSHFPYVTFLLGLVCLRTAMGIFEIWLRRSWFGDTINLSLLRYVYVVALAATIMKLLLAILG